MILVFRAAAMVAASVFLFSSAQATVDHTCIEPTLNIDPEDETQVQLLAQDFRAYEECIVDFAKSALEIMNASTETLELAFQDESFTPERAEAELKIMTEYRDAVTRAKQDLITLIEAILEKVPAEEFNQWDAVSKAAERQPSADAP